MGITKELREYAAMFDNVWLNPTNDTITFTTSDIPPAFDSVRMNNRILAIADRIDAEYQKAIRELNNLADASRLLPVDADGMPIRVGDQVQQNRNGWVYTVTSITFWKDTASVAIRGEHGCGSDKAGNLHHYHKPTIEDVLHELIGKSLTVMEIHGEDKLVAEYAAKLQLRGDAE